MNTHNHGTVSLAVDDLQYVVVGGDIVPTAGYAELFSRGDSDQLFGDLAREFGEADYSIVNLECPLVAEPNPIVKTGKNYRAPAECLLGIKSAGIRAVNLANNHILDQGALGLESTLAACSAMAIDHVGAGRSLEEAGRPLVRNLGPVRVAFLALAEHEFSIAGGNSWGANPLSVINFCRTAATAKGSCDYLIVLVHGGAEYYPFPSPELQKVCRFLIEVGASAVICQHSHCAGSYEWHRGCPIVYGQGNLIAEGWQEGAMEWHKGFLVRLGLAPAGAGIRMETVSYLQSFGQLGARRMTFDEDAAFRQELQQRSAVLENEEKVRDLWSEHCRKKKADCLRLVYGYGRILAAADRRWNITERLLSNKRLAELLSLLRCESHREAFQTVLEDLLRERVRQERYGRQNKTSG